VFSPFATKPDFGFQFGGIKTTELALVAKRIESKNLAVQASKEVEKDGENILYGKGMGQLMKRIIISFLILLGTIIYLISRIALKTLNLSEISMKAKNPVTFDGLSIGINTNIIENNSQSIYYISMIPIYLLIIVAAIGVIWGLKKVK